MKTLLTKTLFFVALIALAASCGTQADESIGSIGLTESELQANYRVEIDRKYLAPWQDSISVNAGEIPICYDSFGRPIYSEALCDKINKE